MSYDFVHKCGSYNDKSSRYKLVYRTGLTVSFPEVDKIKTQQKFQVSNCELLKKRTTTTKQNKKKNKL